MNTPAQPGSAPADTATHLLQQVSEECAGLHDQETLLGRLAHLISGYLHTPYVRIALLEDQRLHFRISALGCAEDLAAILPPAVPLDEQSQVGTAALRRATILGASQPQRVRTRFHQTVAQLSIPIPRGPADIHGVLDIQAANPHHGLDSNQTVLELVARQIGLALDAQEWQAVGRRRQRYAALIDSIRSRAENHLDNEALLSIITTIVFGKTLFRAVGLYMVHHNHLVLRGGVPRDMLPATRPLSIAMQPAPPPHWVSTLPLQAEPAPREVDVALLSGSVLLGVLTLITHLPLVTHERELLNELGRDIGQVIERNRLISSLYVANERNTLFARIVGMIRQSLNVHELINDVAVTLGRGMNIDFCTIGLQEQGDLQLHGLYSTEPSFEHQTAAEALLKNELQNAIAERKHCIINDIRHDDQLGATTRTALQSLNITAIVWIPLQENSQWLGVICVYKLHRPHRWSLDELRLLTDVADQMALALRQTSLYEAERQRRRELETLQEIIRSISGELSLTALCQNVAHKLIDVFHISAVAILMWNNSHDEMHVVAAAGFSPRYVPNLVMAAQTVKYWLERFPPPTPLYIADVRHDPVLGGDSVFAEGLTSLFAQPLMVDGAFSGWLQMYNRATVREWNDEQMHLVVSIAQQIAQAIHAARLYEKEHVLRTDAEQSYNNLRAVLTELENTRERLLQSEKLRSLGELASGVAHDFNNLLASILGNTQLLLLDEAADERREALHMIERAAKDGAVTVRRIQEYARSSETVYNDVVNLSEVVTVGLEFTRPSWRDGAQQRGIALEIVIDLTPVYVLGSEAELREVFVNLLVNAVDALPSGGTITVSSGIKNDWAFFSVTDSGKGISAENRARIFDPFFTTKPIGEGTGMGLAVALSIIQRHRGTLHVDNIKPHGARFIAIMPRHYPEVVEASPVVVAKTSTQSILVVDDEASIRQMVARVLSHDKHVVTVADSGAHALELLRERDFDIIISDLGMPGINGWELLAQARSLHPTIATVLMTGWGYQYETDMAQSRGVDMVLPKPFEMQELRKAIADLLGAPPTGTTRPASR